jgi:hypothetical protein
MQIHNKYSEFNILYIYNERKIIIHVLLTILHGNK